MLTMSWRRFKVLFNRVFSWKDPEEEAPLRDQVDWSNAKHTPISELTKRPAVDLSQYVEQFPTKLVEE